MKVNKKTTLFIELEKEETERLKIILQYGQTSTDENIIEFAEVLNDEIDYAPES